MSGHKRKIKAKASVETVSGILGFVRGLFPDQASWPEKPEEVREIELKLKARKDGVELTLEVKSARPSARDGKAARSSGKKNNRDGDGGSNKTYRLLKKKLQKNFDAISKDLARGKLPEKGAATKFLEQCRVMTQFAGKGDEGYPAFLQALNAFELALAAENVVKARKGLATIAGYKKSCHRQWK